MQNIPSLGPGPAHSPAPRCSSPHSHGPSPSHPPSCMPWPRGFQPQLWVQCRQAMVPGQWSWIRQRQPEGATARANGKRNPAAVSPQPHCVPRGGRTSCSTMAQAAPRPGGTMGHTVGQTKCLGGPDFAHPCCRKYCMQALSLGGKLLQTLFGGN